MRGRAYILSLWMGIMAFGCTQEQAELPELRNEDIRRLMAKVTEVMVHDVTNPPLAARFFAYINLSGYEVMVQHVHAGHDSTLQSMAGVLNEFPEITKPDIEGHSPSLSALLAMMETAQKIQPSGSMIEAYEQQFLDSCKRLGYSEEVIAQSKNYAQDISKQVLAYVKNDRYREISNYPKYTPLEGKGHWYPTPPAYFAAVEPHFNTVRPLTMDSASQFKPAPPAEFSEDKDSPYFQMLMEVYEEGESLPQEHRRIASFWDCNPFAMQNNGHLMVGLKKISPGAHWMGITSIACEKANKSFSESVKLHTVVAVGLMDAFISCWDEKYRSNRIRPETAIRKYIDPTWEPLLQTPPFPEYTSGHSTISGASAYILTYYLGDNFSYTDDVEVGYGIPARDFTSFMAAAKEAAVSRLYGGIHYRDANENGTAQGLKVGEWVINTIEKESMQNLAKAE
ncbi:vanadium-dependent haloperoxidase [Catalinimonas sp. 4WD22]|uniref:vanadium-dependent haloperoxidase n=1 Tax=Catalinimonas locisalis TaxID=3133978 RepID=UPI0031017D81